MDYSFKYFKSDYFTSFEKLWIEGFVKEGKASSDDAVSLLEDLRKNGTESIKEKAGRLLTESDKFSAFAVKSFAQSWERALGFSVKRVASPGPLDESSVAGAKAAVNWWLKDAPVQITGIIRKQCRNNFVIECLQSNGTLIEEIGRFTFRNSEMLSKLRPGSVLESIDKTKGKRFPDFDFAKEILAFEPAFGLVPETANLVNAIVWTAENMKRLPAKK